MAEHDKMYMMRLTDAEKEILKQNAKDAGYSTTIAYLRAVAIRKRGEESDDSTVILKEIRILLKSILAVLQQQGTGCVPKNGG